MKHLIWVMATLVMVASCGVPAHQDTPQGYVKHCVRILDKEALYADSPQWKAKKKAVLAQKIATMEEAHALVAEAAGVAGGKHTFLQAPVKDTVSYPEEAPETAVLKGGILYVKLPAHSGVKISDARYMLPVLEFLRDHKEPMGRVIDLRGNTGGNMYPMIAAISPLLPDGVVLRFKGRKRTTPIWLEAVIQSQNIPAKFIFKCEETPTAILTDGQTASSGEATLLCFRGLKHVRTFGAPTAGYASANQSHILKDGYLLAVTISGDMARTGEVFCDSPIVPDVRSAEPLKDAINWILSLSELTEN